MIVAQKLCEQFDTQVDFRRIHLRIVSQIKSTLCTSFLKLLFILLADEVRIECIMHSTYKTMKNSTWHLLPQINKINLKNDKNIRWILFVSSKVIDHL